MDDLYLKETCCDCGKPHQWSIKKAVSDSHNLREMIRVALCNDCWSKFEENKFPPAEEARISDKILGTV